MSKMEADVEKGKGSSVHQDKTHEAKKKKLKFEGSIINSFTEKGRRKERVK